jgi:ABC-2 type transport system ATP-binding protein
MLMANALEIDSLTKAFGSFVAVDDVSLEVGKGEFMGLLGPNGAGKSTILKVVTGMLAATSGKIMVNGVDSRDHRRAMENVGCVIETPECYPNFTPVEMLEYIGRLRGIGKAELPVRIKDVLEEVRMWEWRHKAIGKFSKGMKQRISIAQALLPDPDLLLLDEPTSGLDPRGMVEIREILEGLKDRDKSLLISSHMLGEVSELCGSVTVIRRGRKVMGGRVRDLLRRNEADVVFEVEVRNPVTPDFIRDLTVLEGVTRVEKTDEFGFDVCITGNNGGQDDVVDLIRSHGLGFMTMNNRGSDLESLYMSLTSEEDRDDIS